MTDAEIFGKLSRIFETHAFARDDHQDDEDIEELLEDFDHQPSLHYLDRSNLTISPSKSRGDRGSDFFSPNERPKPYQVWQKKHSSKLENQEGRPPPKLTGEQWDRLVNKMHQSNRTKQSAMIKEQNTGLALELGGYLFKPRINKTSQDLSTTMKSLEERMPEILAERKKEMDAKRKEAAEAEVAECTFSPVRGNKKTSEKYLKRMGREKKKDGLGLAEDLFKYEEERKKRIELRKAIVEEVESKELTFKPQISEKSLKLQEKLVREGVLSRDPTTRTAIAVPDGSTKAINFRPSSTTLTDNTVDARYEDGPMLVIESEHPYRNNTNEFTTVAVPGAVSYAISFSEETKTEAIHDFVKFFEDERHLDHFGAGKYSGGANDSPYNWPGLDGRPPLIIPAPKFIINFRTNGSINDWGFRMMIIPKLLVNNNPANNNQSHLESISLSSPAIPNISDAAKHYKPSEKVHDRLYKHAVIKHADQHNSMVDLMQNKLNITLKPWETSRSAAAVLSASMNSDLGGEANPAAHHYVKLYSKTHLPKAPLSEAVEELLVPENFQQLPDGNISVASTNTRSVQQNLRNRNTSLVKIGKKAVSVVEFDDSLNGLWKQLRTL